MSTLEGARLILYLPSPTNFKLNHVYVQNALRKCTSLNCDHNCRNVFESICPTSQSSDEVREQPDPISERAHVRTVCFSQSRDAITLTLSIFGATRMYIFRYKDSRFHLSMQYVSSLSGKNLCKQPAVTAVC